jgi:hypothetical protein
MGFNVGRLTVLMSFAVLLASCEDPLAPERETTAPLKTTAPLESQGGPPSSGDPSAWGVSPTEINLTWPDNSNNEAGWEIHRSTTGREGAFSLLAKTAADVTTYSDGGLTPLTEYCYRIRSFKTSGRKTTFGAFSVTTCAITYGPPGAPTNLSVTPNIFGMVDLSWTNSLTANEFRVERAETTEGPWVQLVKLLPWQQPVYRDEGRPLEQQVCYRIVAVNAYGETPSVADCTTPPREPGPLAASSPDEQSIALSWADNSAAEDGYEVQRAGDDIVWGVIATLPANATGYIDRAVTANTSYWYKVRATKDGGFSYPSNTVNAAAASTPPEAPGVSLSPGSSSSVNVYWGPGSPTTDGFRLERSMDDGGSWVIATTTNKDQSGFSDEGLSSERRVCYRLFASNRLGDSPPSTMACTTPPAAPTNLVTVSIDEQTVEHQWTDNSAVEDGYELWLFVVDEWNNYYYYPVYLGPDVTSYRAGASEFVYGVIAQKDGGYSDWAFPPTAMTAAALKNRTAATARPPASAQRTPPTLGKDHPRR